MDGRILLVEDDASIREIVALGLRAIGFDVVTAADGPSGIERWHATGPDLVLLDVMLPGLDGLAVCREIRRTSMVPIVMLTARGDTVDVVRGLEAGADDYVRKPFEMPELVARVRAAVRRAPSSASSAEAGAAIGGGPAGTGGSAAARGGRLTLGPLAIDLDGRTVHRGETEVALTRTELDLLAELAARPGQVLSRELLLDRVWGYDYLGDSRLVDVAVGRLRAKVEEDPGQPRLILTVRGSGYKADPG